MKTRIVCRPAPYALPRAVASLRLRLRPSLGGFLTPLLPVIALAIGGAADAADLAVKAPPAALPFSWTGCSIGGHLGGGWERDGFGSPDGFHPPGSQQLLVNPTISTAQPLSGLLVGGQAGCKYQFAPNWVVGVGGQLSGGRIVGTRGVDFALVNPLFDEPATFKTKTDGLASVTGSLGYVFNGVLLYAKGGAAWAHTNYEIQTPFFPLAPLLGGPAAATDYQASQTRTGWTVGAGLEYPFRPNWTATFGYDFYDFGNGSVNFFDPVTSTTGSLAVKQRIQTVTFGLNYYFWDGGARTPAAYADASPVPAPLSQMTWSQTFSTETRYFAWQSNRGYPTNGLVFTNQIANPIVPNTARGSGFEIYTPYAAQLVGQSPDFKVELLGRGGWVQAHQSTGGLVGDVQTATDTVVNGTVTYLGFNGFQPFASLNLNLPTGLSALTPSQVGARMDPDLVDVSTFGEGLNIGPTLGFNLPLNSSWLATMSVGFTHRGAYELEAPIAAPLAAVAPVNPTNVQPGDVLTLTGSIGYASGPFSGTLTATATTESPTVQDNQPFIRPGNRYMLAATASYNWQGEHVGTTTLTSSVSHSQRNEITFQCQNVVCPAGLVPEAFDTNSDLWRIGVEHLFAFDRVAFGPIASFLFRNHNGYDSETVQFVPAKTRTAAGAQARYAATDNVTLNAKVEHVWTSEGSNPATQFGKFSLLAQDFEPAFTIPVVSSNGWQVTIGATARF